MVEHKTVIIGINDAEELGLIKVNIDLVEKEKIKIINEVKDSQDFKHQIEKNYPDLFRVLV